MQLVGLMSGSPSIIPCSLVIVADTAAVLVFLFAAQAQF